MFSMIDRRTRMHKHYAVRQVVNQRSVWNTEAVLRWEKMSSSDAWIDSAAQTN